MHRKVTPLVSVATVFAAAVPVVAGNVRYWISKYASYEVIGTPSKEALPSLLTAEGRFHNQGTEDAYALSVKPGKDVGVIIDLGKVEKIYSVVIKNRGNSANQVGLAVACSTDRKKWTTRDTWVVKRAAWAWCMSVRTQARYVRLSRPDKNTDKPRKLSLLATGETLGYKYEGRALTVRIPAAKTTALLDVIKAEW